MNSEEITYTSNKVDMAIFSADKWGSIGENGSALYRNAQDRRFFKSKTKNCFLLMGSKTFFSLPFPKLLTQRDNFGIIITKEPAKFENRLPPNFFAMTEEQFLDPVSFLSCLIDDIGYDEAIKAFFEKRIVMIGGVYLYNQMDKFGVQRVYLTRFKINEPKGEFFINLKQPIFNKRPRLLYRDREIDILEYNM